MRRPYRVIVKSTVGRVMFEERGVDETGTTPDDALIAGARACAIAEGRIGELEAEFAQWSVEDDAG